MCCSDAARVLTDKIKGSCLASELSGITTPRTVCPTDYNAHSTPTGRDAMRRCVWGRCKGACAWTARSKTSKDVTVHDSRPPIATKCFNCTVCTEPLPIIRLMQMHEAEPKVAVWRSGSKLHGLDQRSCSTSSSVSSGMGDSLGM